MNPPTSIGYEAAVLNSDLLIRVLDLIAKTRIQAFVPACAVLLVNCSAPTVKRDGATVSIPAAAGDSSATTQPGMASAADPGATAPIQTDRRLYAPDCDSVVAIVATYTNPVRIPTYIASPGSFPSTWYIDRLIDGRWEQSYYVASILERGPPIRVAGGQSYTHGPIRISFPVWREYQRRLFKEPAAQVAAGTYRLRFSIYSDSLSWATRGPQVPEAQRASNSFRVCTFNCPAEVLGSCNERS